jgi:fructose-bisphosphate aldolase, class II
LTGFANAGSDGIVRITAVGAAAPSGGGRAHPVAGARPRADGEGARRAVSVSVALDTDHCPPALLDTFLETAERCIRGACSDGGDPVFNSYMFDG